MKGPSRGLVAAAAVAASLWSASGALAAPISTDPYSNTTSQHATEVEPDTFAQGSTIVAAFQAGRFTNGGSSDIGWATSTDSGTNWSSGFLPSITKYGDLATPTNHTGPYDRVSDPSVAYDAQDDVWLIASLALKEQRNGSVKGVAVLVSRSTDGGVTWGDPVTVATNAGGKDLDKTWIACDNIGSGGATPPDSYFGNCYATWDDFRHGDRLKMSTSTDGGLTWGPALETANHATGLGGQPVVQPDHTVVVPASNAYETAIIAFKSTNGGGSWSATTTVANVSSHNPGGGLRSGPLPSAEVDADGKVYVVWEDCRFHTRCSANDIVLSTSSDGSTWSPVVGIPDSTNASADHFIPGLAVTGTSSTGVKLGLTYYYYPAASCTAATCALDVGFVSSANGGTGWSAPAQLAGPMTLSWLASTSQGPMVGDYISSSFAGDGNAHPVFAGAGTPTGSVFDEAMYSSAQAASGGGNAVTAAANAVITPTGSHNLPENGASNAAPQAPVTHR